MLICALVITGPSLEENESTKRKHPDPHKFEVKKTKTNYIYGMESLVSSAPADKIGPIVKTARPRQALQVRS